VRQECDDRAVRRWLQQLLVHRGIVGVHRQGVSHDLHGGRDPARAGRMQHLHLQPERAMAMHEDVVPRATPQRNDLWRVRGQYLRRDRILRVRARSKLRRGRCLRDLQGASERVWRDLRAGLRCDGQNYENSCSAAMKGTGVLNTGSCANPAVCKTGETKDDGCNTCSCSDGTWTCTHRTCTAPPCQPGETKPADDGCNSCSCSDNHEWLCTQMACPAPKACGARAGNTCNSAEYCAYQPGAYCGQADAQSTCQRRPDACDDIYAPVCGCDQKTYASACAAASAGVGTSSSGTCPVR